MDRSWSLALVCVGHAWVKYPLYATALSHSGPFLRPWLLRRPCQPGLFGLGEEVRTPDGVVLLRPLTERHGIVPNYRSGDDAHYAKDFQQGPFFAQSFGRPATVEDRSTIDQC